jgi:hypothetical protein
MRTSVNFGAQRSVLMLTTIAWPRVSRSLVCAAFAILFAASSGCASLQPKKTPDAQLRARAEQLLTRYAANDPDAVVAILDPREFTLYGSDSSEIVHTVSELRELMHSDFALWGTAKFGAIEHFDARSDGNLATTYFSAPFFPGNMGPIPVRFCMTWRRADDQWLLTQSANAVPTVDQSAADLLKRMGK